MGAATKYVHNGLCLINYFYFYGPPLSRKTRKTNTEVTSVVLLDLRQYYEKSSLAVFSYTC
jgi:hypothetical protein